MVRRAQHPTERPAASGMLNYLFRSHAAQLSWIIVSVARKDWISTPTGSHLRGRRTRNTEPELSLRRALHATGARFRLHRQLAKGCTPDLVLPARRIAVFVDGDFWHGCPEHHAIPSFRGPNAALWLEKLQYNRQRDLRATALAEEAGWRVIRLWECEVRSDPAGAAQKVLANTMPESGTNPDSDASAM